MNIGVVALDNNVGCLGWMGYMLRVCVCVCGGGGGYGYGEGNAYT